MCHLFFTQKKNKVNKKRKLEASQKCKESKRQATYSIHHFWKQDLSTNNSLPNFSDDLNVHRNPSVSKSSTLNIIADNFSSHDNNVLKLNDSEQHFISKSYSSDCISNSKFVNKSIPQNFNFSLVVKLNIV